MNKPETPVLKDISTKSIGTVKCMACTWNRPIYNRGKAWRQLAHHIANESDKEMSNRVEDNKHSSLFNIITANFFEY